MAWLWLLYLIIIIVVCTASSCTGSSTPVFPQHKYFLRESYRVKGDDQLAFRVRQVPGDGGCLFHALSACVSYSQTNAHVEFDWRLRNLSHKLRHLAVSILKGNQTLVVESGESVDSCGLLEMVADHYNMTADQYCEQMAHPRTWGGGPEIVALSNHFRCPIHVYQLGVSSGLFQKTAFCFELCAKFGRFDDKSPLYLLCADGRFPHIKPGKHKAVGDHFLALFLANPDPKYQQQQHGGGGGGQKSSELPLRADGQPRSAENDDGRLPCLDISICPEIIKHAGSAPLDSGYRRRRSWFMRWLSKH